jgi:Fe-S cluster assembly scaffold IscU
MSYSTKVVDAVEGVLHDALNQKSGNVGSFDVKDKNVGTGLVGAPACGDVMKLQIRVNDQGKIEDVKFKTFGCGSAIASSNFACEAIKGESIDHALSITNEQISQFLSLPPVKRHCSLLAEDAIKAAIADYIQKQSQSNE